ncbi:MAG: hypothetical protein JSS02_20930 [Planctomycetes bacterium]|nr:hypothetical protein [Planctomycetota bacterium]
MTVQLSALVLCAAMNGGTLESTVYESYKQAWHVAHVQNRPVLVILNPGEDSEETPVDIEWLKRTKHRREILNDYVVCVIDTSTPEGKAVQKKFNATSLPKISVLDRQQKWQIYQSSKELSAEDWNMVLETHRKGNPPPPRPQPAQCLT